MPLLGITHLGLLIGIAAAAAWLSALCRSRGARFSRPARLALGLALAANELVWWIFRYSHEGIHAWNLPLQLCDVTVWSTVCACLWPVPLVVELSYFAGLAGAGMALLTPDLWSPWPSYPAVYFFLAHGGVVIGVSLLVFGRVTLLSRRAPWRAFALLLMYAAVLGGVDALLGANYMYLCRKPKAASLLNAFGPWPVYLAGGAAAALALFWLLSIPVRAASRTSSRQPD
jgi:hypothetical integral membrane protein (TIGR02206 family)